MDYLIAPDRTDTAEYTLRSYEPGEGLMLSQAICSSYEHLRTFMPWASPDYSVEEAERFCRTSLARYLLAEDFTLGIFSPDGRRLLGGTGYHLREGGLSTHNAEIGMWIRADAAGRGLGTRVLVTLLRWGFDDWPWLRLSWRCDVRNVASARVATKAGMHREGLLRSDFPLEDGTRRDTLIFSAVRDEWLSQYGDAANDPAR
jgi:RimJ/RimL family protein N-acetyltransferase